MVDFIVPVDHRVNIKESEKRHNGLGPRQITKKPCWDMKVTVILVVICALGTVPRILERGLEELEIRKRIETIRITAFLRSTRILRIVLDTWEESNDKFETGFQIFVQVIRYLEMNPTMMLIRMSIKEY